jgi:hypothetical protein
LRRSKPDLSRGPSFDYIRNLESEELQSLAAWQTPSSHTTEDLFPLRDIERSTGDRFLACSNHDLRHGSEHRDYTPEALRHGIITNERSMGRIETRTISRRFATWTGNMTAWEEQTIDGGCMLPGCRQQAEDASKLSSRRFVGKDYSAVPVDSRRGVLRPLARTGYKFDKQKLLSRGK